MTLVKWALAPQGPDRFKKVEIETYDRSKSLNKRWTFAKAYLASISETESGGGQHTQTVLHIVGTLVHGAHDYDGTNILKVEAGDAEALPG